MTQEAHLYRLATQEHICPFGLKARALLKRQGYKVIDHKLTSREQADKLWPDSQNDHQTSLLYQNNSGVF